MSIAADLGYAFKRPNLFQRAMQAFASSRFGAWLFSKLLHHLDDLVGRLSGGRHSVPGLLAGLPVVDVTTTGRKSGLRRTTHLISIPIGDTLALLGTNFGQSSTPAWVFNLEADPRASVAFRGRTLEVGPAGDRDGVRRGDDELRRRVRRLPQVPLPDHGTADPDLRAGAGLGA